MLCLILLSQTIHSQQSITHPGSHPTSPFALEGITIDQLQLKLKRGEYTSREITQMYLDRIEQIDKSGPALHAVIETNPDALAIADSLDMERAHHLVRGPLHGIPVLIKDNIDTGDKMKTTAGSLAMEGNRAAKDASVVHQLREAGAIILGKTNLTEWANFRASHSISGWSSRGGQTKNPYVIGHTPCGSSSGSAVAVSADLCVVAVGTETDGSIACPASMNGVVGIKPTVGLIDCSGIIPISKSMDSPGPLARTVRDAAILLGTMKSVDVDKGLTGDNPEENIRDYTPYLDRNGLKGKRIGVEKAMLQEREGIGALLQEAIQQMEKKGAIIVEIEYAAKYNEVAPAEVEIMKYEFKDGLNRYLSTSDGPMKSLADILQYNRDHASQVMPYFKQDLMESAQAKGALDSYEYKSALTKRKALRNDLDALMTSNQLDAVAGVGSGTYSPAAMAGYPSITVPMGLDIDVPVGITFFGKAFDEPGLLRIAYAYEQVSNKRTSPKFLTTTSGQ